MKISRYRLMILMSGLVRLSVFGLFITLGAQASQASKPIIELIEGDQLVVIKSPAGSSRSATVGAEVSIGDKVKTGPKATAKIRYPDGSKLLVGRGTELEIQEHNGKSQFNSINSGSVRGLIRKAGDAAKSGPPRFIIRSRSVVMGVRGTDFVMSQVGEAAKAALDIHTLDGTVEVAKDEAALMSGKGVSVSKDMMIHADGSVLQAPQVFEKSAFEKLMAEAQPDFSAIVKRDPEAFRASHEDALPGGIEPVKLKETPEQQRKREEEQRRQEEEAKTPPKPRLDRGQWQLGGLYVFQNPSSYFATGQLSWTPTFRIFWILGIRGFLGVAPVFSAFERKDLILWEGGFRLKLDLFWSLLSVEMGPSWRAFSGGPGRTDSMPSAQVSLNLSEDGFIQRVYGSVGLGGDFESRLKNQSSGNRNQGSIFFQGGVGFKF